MTPERVDPGGMRQLRISGRDVARQGLVKAPAGGKAEYRRKALLAVQPR
jgi:hypothetical protein